MPPARSRVIARIETVSGGVLSERKASFAGSAYVAAGFSLLRLSVPMRLVLAGAAAALLWLCVWWALA
jgi:hypothetical protein